MMDLDRLDWILTKAQETELTEWEETFVADLTERRERFGNAIRISNRQEAALERIAEK